MNSKNAILGCILSTISLCSFAYQQDNQSQGDRIEAFKIAFITQQLNLTPQEAEKFWPTYNAYKGELDAVRRSFPKDNLTADQQLDLEQRKLDLKKKYRPQFEAALGTEKLNRLYNLEREFQEKLRQIREQRMQQRGNSPGTAPGRRFGTR